MALRITLGPKHYEFNPNQLKFILWTVSQATGVSEADIIKKGRKGDVALARHIYCSLCAKYTKNIFKRIGWLINKRGHTTIRNSIKVSNNLLHTGYEPMICDYQQAERALILAGYKPKQLKSKVRYTQAA